MRYVPSYARYVFFFIDRDENGRMIGNTGNANLKLSDMTN